MTLLPLNSKNYMRVLKYLHIFRTYLHNIVITYLEIEALTLKMQLNT